MANVQIKESSYLSLDEVQKQLPSTYQISSLESSEVGKQKRNTVIIGEMIDVQRRRIRDPRMKPALRLKLKEVLPIGNRLHFDVVIFGKTVNLIEEGLKSKGRSPLWIGFSNLLVVQYTGQEDNWSSFGLKVDDEEDNEEKKTNLEQEIVLFFQRSKTNEFSLKYSTLNEIRHKARITVFVIVTKILKEPVLLANKAMHIMLSLIDPSCLEENATYKDIPLHIFLNDPPLDSFPEPFARGDILRIRDLLGDMYSEEKKMYGKIYHTKAVVKFLYNEEEDKIIPVTTNSSYILTGQDENMARQLRQWWLKNLEKKEKENCFIDPLLLEKKICDVTSPCTFNLNCLVKDVCVVEDREVVILRVSDGTKSNVLVNRFNFDEPTQEFSSQNEEVSAVIDSMDIDVGVFEPLLEKASSLKAGDMIQLIHVICVDLSGGQGNLGKPVLDFYLRHEECEIRNVQENSSISRHLISTTVEQSVTSGTLPQLPKNSPSVLKSVATFSPFKNLIDESLSPPPSHRLLANENGTDVEESVTYPVLVEQASLSSSGNNFTTFENIERKQINSEFVENSDTVDKRKMKNFIRNTSTPKCKSTETKETSKAKRKSPHEHSYLKEPKNKITSYIWQNVKCDTICEPHDKTSLTDFCENSKEKDKGRVWAILKHIHCITTEPCDKCGGMNCYHDWIWGLCGSCGKLFTPTLLREHFSADDLLTLEALSCFLCSSASKLSADIQPIIKLDLCLEDVNNNNSYSVDLRGDWAELFFGVKAAFKWTLESMPSSLLNRINLFHQFNAHRPFQYGLINHFRKDGTRSIQICDTKLNF